MLGRGDKEHKMTIRERVDAVLIGQTPDRLPFVDRPEVWHRCLTYPGALPAEYQNRSLTEIHQAVGMGQQKSVIPYALKLRGVEDITAFNRQAFCREYEPVIEAFPSMWDLVDMNRAGTTVTELITPAGTLRVQQELIEENLATGTEAYLREHLNKSDGDYETAEYILERCEYVPQFERVMQCEEAMGGMGYVVP